jgi:serine/threonine protein kinase
MCFISLFIYLLVLHTFDAFQLERNEGCTVAQERDASIHYNVLFIHHHALLRLSHDVSYTLTPFLYAFSYAHACPFANRAYFPRLVPVEVDEPIAKVWFKSLLGGVEFLHARGVVHNDIK